MCSSRFHDLRPFPDYTTVYHTAIMFGIGIPEFLVILVIALIFVGPERLPEVAKMFSKIFADFRKATDDVSEELRNARQMLEEEIRQAEREVQEEQSSQSTGLPPGGQPEGTPGSVPRTKGNAALPSAADKKESSSGESA
jgi:sec-independent protein translocase protein TatA